MCLCFSSGTADDFPFLGRLKYRVHTKHNNISSSFHCLLVLSFIIYCLSFFVPHVSGFREPGIGIAAHSITLVLAGTLSIVTYFLGTDRRFSTSCHHCHFTTHAFLDGCEIKRRSLLSFHPFISALDTQFGGGLPYDFRFCPVVASSRTRLRQEKSKAYSLFRKEYATISRPTTTPIKIRWSDLKNQPDRIEGREWRRSGHLYHHD